MKEMIAMTAILGGAGIKGSLAATAMKNAFTRLAAPTRSVSDGLARIGLSRKNLITKTGDMKSMNVILGMIGERTKKLGKADQLAVFSSIFGARAIAGAANLKDNISSVTDLMIKLGNDPMTQLEKMAAFMRGSLGNRLRLLGSTVVEVGFKFFSAFDVQAKNGLDSLNTAILNFDMNRIIEPTKKAFEIFSWLLGVLKPFASIIPVIVGGLLAYNAALKVMAMYEAIKGFILFTRAIRAAALAQGVLNTVMMLNPIGLIITGITALVAVGVLLYKNWDLVSATFKKVWGWFMKILDNPFIAAIAVLFTP
jgi:hypothetical protein